MLPNSYRITTVTTAATSIALTTLAHVKEDLAIVKTDADSFLLRKITQASRAAANYCNRSFAQQSYQEIIRLARGLAGTGVPGGVQPIALTSWPVTALASVTETLNGVDTALVEGDDFEVDQTKGYLYRLDLNGNPRDWSPFKLVVAYTAGYMLPGQQGANLPEDVEDATIRLVKTAYFARGRDPLVKQESVPDVGETTFWVTSGTGGNLPPDVEDLLDNYRVPVTA